jgi:nitrilase
LKIAVIQTSSLPYEQAKINYFLSILRAKNVKLVVIGEYVLNLFFKDLENTPINFVKQHSNKQIKLFKKLAKTYNINIIAPVVIGQKGHYFKVFAKFSPNSTRLYYQQLFIPYSHWNEKKFFHTKKNKPLIFKIENFNIALLAGFETHFDEYWEYFRKKRVELVVVPSVGTFNSKERWRRLLSTKAFLNNCYVLRANRIGKYNDWIFYGDSFLMDPNGEMVDNLNDKEELMIVDIDKKIVKTAKKEWAFMNIRKDLLWQE